MGRWDHDDPADEHDIRELRKANQSGKKPELIGKPGRVKGGGCPLVLLVLVAAPVVAAVAAVKGLG